MAWRFSAARIYRAATTSHTRPISSLGLAAKRRELLLKIYSPFKDFDKDGQQYMDLARSGRVWEDYHRPSDSVKKGYIKLQEVSTSL